MLTEREVPLSRQEKVLWPETGFTKGELVAYYREVAPVMIPHLAHRAVTLLRCPDGVEGPAWFQSNCRGNPAWIPTVEIIGRKGQRLHYCVINEPAALIWATNLATIEFHPFLHTIDRPDHPRALVFDLDPGPPATILDCCRVALRMRAHFEALGLQALVKVSGQRGLHLLIPLGPESPHTYDETRAWARGIARFFARAHPDEIVDRSARPLREGRVFIDWSQNSAGKSTVAPYSLRAVRFPFVSMPMQWSEMEHALAHCDVGGLVFGPEDVPARVDAHGDLWWPALHLEQRLPLVVG